MRMRTPLAAMNGMRLSFAPISPPRLPAASASPEPPAAASAGISRRKPHGIVVLTATTAAAEPMSSATAVESQKIAIVRIAVAPARGWMIFNMGFVPFPRRSLRLGDADAWDRDLLEEVRSRDGRGRIGGEFRHELRVRERGSEGGGRLPDGGVEIGRALADRAMKLSRDEAWLPLHKLRVVPPCLKKGRLVRLIEHEDVHEHDGRGVDRKLTFDRESGIQRAQGRHETLRSFWQHDANLLLWSQYRVDIIMSI